MKHILCLVAFAAIGPLRAQTITEYRYWINDDIATLTNTSIGPSDDVTLNSTLAVSTLTKDFNTITVQFKDGNGDYSVPKTYLFTRSTGEVTGYEYWIDDAIATSTTGAVGPNNVVDLIADLPTSTTAGTHFFTIRFSSMNGSWTVPLTTAFSFFDAIDELPGISDLLLFPNPVTDALGLRLNTDAARTLKLQVLDLSGALVQDLGTWGVHGITSRHWDINALASGSYLLRITDENASWSARFVKQ